MLTIEQYKSRLVDLEIVKSWSQEQSYYDQVTTTMKKQFVQSRIWSDITRDFQVYDQEYRLKMKYDLFAAQPSTDIQIKPFDSCVDKSYRKNVLGDNSNWDTEPHDRLVLPTNWYEKIGDILRTCLVVKYLDGVEFTIDKIAEAAHTHGCPCNLSMEARTEGYYAAHITITHDFEIPKWDWDTRHITADIEIQVTTQLQEVIRKLLHKHYETSRSSPDKSADRSWQWKYKSDEFHAAYLGHILHYVEGMIMEVRDKQKE